MAAMKTAMEQFETAARSFIEFGESVKAASKQRLQETETEIREKSTRLAAINAELITAMAAGDGATIKALRTEERALSGSLSDLRQISASIADTSIQQISSQKYTEIERLAAEAWKEHEAMRRKAAEQFNEITDKIDKLLDEQDTIARTINTQNPVPNLLYHARTLSGSHVEHRRMPDDLKSDLYEKTGVHTRIEVRQPKNAKGLQFIPFLYGASVTR